MSSTLTGSRRLQAVALCTVTLLLVAGKAQAALTTGGCLAQKQKAWGGLGKCEAGEKAKLLQGKPADLAKCQTKLQDKLAKLTAKATDAAIACRYGDNGDGTVTDYDTGLQWEQKTDDGSVHDKDHTYSWNTTFGGTTPNGTAFTAFLGTLNNGTSGGGSVTSGCFAGHCDWRLPAIEELQTILLAPYPCETSPCIDQTVFGPTVAINYWSASTFAGFPHVAWLVYFDDGYVNLASKDFDFNVRAVRAGS